MAKSAKKGVKSILKAQVGTVWLVLGAVVLVTAAWVTMMNKGQSPVGINQVAETQSALESWEFDDATDMGKGTGWYAQQPINYNPADVVSGSTTPASIRDTRNVATTLVDGMMAFPIVVNSNIKLINTSMSLAIPEAPKDMKVVVVATGVSRKANKPSLPPGVQLPETEMKAQLQVGAESGIASVTKTAKAEREGTDLGYSFRVTAQELSKLRATNGLPIKRMELTLALGGYVIEGLKIDKISVLLVDAPPAASAGPSVVTISGTLRVSGRGPDARCVISTQTMGDYQVVYTGPAGSPVASPVKGCPAALADFVRKDVTAKGTLVGNTKMLRIKSLSDIVLND